ncbi:ABC1 kinase family protein [Candidatus Viridilinea mediisalina]|uniref:ABC transporter n=1 Tax=Candidatus Viridilinea mediisalina TaxID=2024553 RepID=A0A2A6RMP6_9CHLR|nr:AarF/UbiB family protein [Candidatus Viridilinea mediisalina]PDW04158.1 ABC transporter [Candidatus Viridilinea mediisalina]
MTHYHSLRPDEAAVNLSEQPAVPRATVAPAFHARQRFLRVSAFFLGVIAHIYFWDIFLVRFALCRWYVQRTMTARWVKLAHKFRLLALELGGMQIKLGQFLSARADIMPDAVRRELAGLQDEVPPAPAGHVLEVILEELGALPQEVFLQFDEHAVAAASLGQVHLATLHDGRQIAVKVQRPYIDRIIEVDLSAVTWVVRLIKNYPPIRRRANLEALLAEFAVVMVRELDYIQEAQSGALFRKNFAGVRGIYVPEPLFEYTTRRVLVMERIEGIKISDLRTLDNLGVSRAELASRLNNCYLKQFFVDGFFHADPHPGNLFVRVEPEVPTVYVNGFQAEQLKYRNGFLENGQLLGDAEAQASKPGRPFTLIFIDFGMVGDITKETMAIIRSGVVGLAMNDPERIVTTLEQLNMILPGSDRRPFVQAVQIMMRHSYNRTMREMTNLDVEAIFDETKDLVYDLPFQIPQNLLYFGRALSMVEGLATEIYPDINLFHEIQPFARRILDEEQRNGHWPDKLQKELRELGQIMLALPRQMDTFYRSANRGELATRIDMARLERGMRRVERSTDRLAGGVVATGFFLGGVQLRTRGLERESQRAWWAAAAALIWMLWPRGER